MSNSYSYIDINEYILNIASLNSNNINILLFTNV